MKVSSGNEKQTLLELDPNFMSNEEDGEDLAGTWIVRSPPWHTVHDCHHCYRSYNKKLTASLLRAPKTAEFEERHVPALHHPLHQHGQCVLMTEKETMRGPPLHCQQLCTQSSRSPSEYGSGDESDENLDNLFPDSPVRIPRQRRCVRVLQD